MSDDLERLAMEVDIETIPSDVLRRLIAEVRQEADAEETPERPRAYNRTHNRHNRSTNNPAWRYNRTHNRHNRG